MPLFQESHNFVASGTFIDQSTNISIYNPTAGAGIESLRKASIPEAIHDSSARDPARCFPGTREEHIRNIIDWATGEWQLHKPSALWMQGPAGVGKSALAQTCAERVGNKLGAAFFFSRINHWNSPIKFIPTIAYQLAIKHPNYSRIIEIVIAHDPLILEKSIDVQFRELLIEPLAKLSADGQKMGEQLIIVDGLDECEGEEHQRSIIQAITTSVHSQTNPFIWAIFSRPEPHISSAFSTEPACNVCWQLTLPVSRDSDHDIDLYLRDGFRMIRARYNLPKVVDWPSEEQIRQLVDQSAGLFIYAASAIRHIAQSPGELGPEEQLRSILELGNYDKIMPSANPLSNLDRFYILIMKQVPKEILPNTLLLLFLHVHRSKEIEAYLPVYCSIIGFSMTTFYATINSLHSVMSIKTQDGMPKTLAFYHASFGDFLRDSKRSTSEFCVENPAIYNRFYSMCVNALCRLSESNSDEPANILSWPESLDRNREIFPAAFHHLLSFADDVLLDTDVLRGLARINWSLGIKCCENWVFLGSLIEKFFSKVPKNWRPKIIQLFHYSAFSRLRNTFSSVKRRKVVEASKEKNYVVGHGRNAALLVKTKHRGYGFQPCPTE